MLEALVGLIIFAVGILGLIGLQMASIKQASEAEYRSVAALQANDLISRMWVSDRTAATLQLQFASPDGAGYIAWKDEWAGALPNTATHAPTVSFTTVDGGGATPVSSSQVEVKVFWKSPGEKADDPAHSYTTVAQLK
ncbi:type IV pilus modification PilV family protein [Variovorax saccharolyticus]|uniref:type IV pilus modification PilV family protein n=1 Tax=Variovorax saccharolyticus TaxID=3053516 RepID=UPI0025751AD0|nr:hypothetical protein [Variovorax sp. J31P216]MDM0027648.1 hypothetical protein [Variovorax sp. J31P216]